MRSVGFTRLSSAPRAPSRIGRTNFPVRNLNARFAASALGMKMPKKGVRPFFSNNAVSYSGSRIGQFTRLAAATPPSKGFGIRYYSSGAGESLTVEVPIMGDSITEGSIQSWKKAEGDYVAMDEVVCEIETDKITVDVRAPQAGTLKKILAQEGEDIEVGADLFVIEVGVGTPPAEAEKPAETPAAAAAPATPAAPAAPSPAAPKPAATPAAPKAAPVAPKEASVFGSRAETRVRMTKMRQRIAERLKDSQNTAAMLTTFNEIDMHNIMQLRQTHRDEFFDKHGVKLGFMSAFVRASALSLQKFPEINAVIDGDEIVYRDYSDISVAVATPNGLVVPVIRNAETLSFAEIETTISELGVKARNGNLAIEEMMGGTFTISNGGVYGSLFGTPIINPPQSAILGMHGINKRAWVVNDEVVVRPIMFVALSYDHRLVDGREAVLFLKSIKEYVEDPTKMLLDL